MKNRRSGPTEIRTQVGGIRTRSDNQLHYRTPHSKVLRQITIIEIKFQHVSSLDLPLLEDPVNDLRHVPDHSTGEFRHASAAIEVSKICQ
jgi:hypothetical protein